MKKAWLEDQRFYPRNGKEYPSVTTILKAVGKPALVPWAASQVASYFLDNGRHLFRQSNLGEEHFLACLERLAKDARNIWKLTSKKAADYGTIVHQILHDIANGLPVVIEQYEEPVRLALKAYWEIEKREGIVYTGKNELTVYDDELKVAGTLDSIVILTDYITVIDYKASTGIYPEHILQVCKYLDMYNKTMGEEVYNAAILRLDKKTGKPELYRVPVGEIGENILIFNNLIPLYNKLFKK